ncbi:MAG: calcium/sodium antiporter [Peptococcaceae bacterium]|nr:calcium/sodium antiporter [Peptococcaceae bacterium]
MLISVLLFALGLVLLIKGGDWFVDGATGVARRFHLPDIIVGATVVSIGTTLPEVMVSTTGALQGQGAMAYGNAIGSIICNTALIAAISVACKPGKVNTKTMRMPVIFFFVCSAIYCMAAYILGEFPQWLGFILLGMFVLYMISNIITGLRNQEDAAEEDDDDDAKERAFWMELVLLVVGAALIAVGADLLVEHGTIIAHVMGVPETVIALTFVALGTSLPELITTITSLRKGHASLGIGNVIGANVFNLALVSGVAVSLAPFELPVGKLLFGYNASLVLDLPLMLIVMSLLTLPALATKKLSRWQGIVLLAIYIAFCLFQFTA